MLRLDKNEYNFKHHPDILSNITVRDIKYYNNGITNQEVILKLSNIISCKPDNILITAGGIGGIELLFNAYLRNTNLITAVPTYSAISKYVIRNNTKLIELHTYLDEKCETIMLPQCDAAVYICNPNNPTGMMWGVNDLRKYASNTSRMILIDEVYVDFADTTCMSLIDLKNVVIIRSFSKSYGLAGIRFGYLLAHPDTITYMKQYYEPLYVTPLAKLFAYSVMDHWDFYQDNVKATIDTRNNFVDTLKSMGLVVKNTPTNFILLYIGINYLKFINELKCDNILIRDIVMDYALTGFVRISIAYDMSPVLKSIQRNISLIDKYPPLMMFYTPCYIIGKLLTLLRVLVRVLNEHDIKYWLAEGTLLAAVRHGSFMKWDDDIDIGVMIDIKDITDSLPDDMMLVKNRFGVYWQLRYTNDVFLPLDEFYKSANYELPHIDLFQYKPIIHDNKKIWINCDDRFVNIGPIKPKHSNNHLNSETETKNKAHSRCDGIYPDNLLFPLKTQLFENIDVTIPSSPAKILDLSLGESYKNTIITSQNGSLYKYDIA